MALQFLPWLIRAGQGLASATGAKGVAKGAAKYLDPRKVPLEKGKRYDVVNNVVQARTRRGAVPNYLSLKPSVGQSFLLLKCLLNWTLNQGKPLRPESQRE
jgi:hypothetical protein